MIAFALAFLIASAQAAGPSPLTSARAHLEAGEMDDVLFVLSGKKFAGKEAKEAAALLGRAAKVSLETKEDSILALQFAQMALKLVPAQPESLEAAARASFQQQQFDPAEDYADRWIAATRRSPRALLLRAEIAQEQGEWSRALALVEGVREASLSAAERGRLAGVREVSRRELQAMRTAASTSKALERRMAEARAAAAALPKEGRAQAASGKVVLYGNSWCGYCKLAREWLRARKIAFEDRDIEKDSGAERELAAKEIAAGIQTEGVPVLDARGTLVEGWNEAEYERLLGR